MLLTLLFVSSCVLLLYYYLKENYTYWLRKNVPYPEPSLFFGNSRNVIMLKATIAENCNKIYEEYKGYPFVGMYELRTPVLLLRDLELIKKVLAKDFAYFQSRGITINENVDPLTAHLINLSGQRWRILRTKLTPAFTVSKIRHICELLSDVSEKFKQFVEQFANNKETVEFRDLAAKFTTESIAICFFGLKTNSIQNGDSEFRTMCKKILEPSFKITLKRIIRAYMPGIFNYLMICMNPSDVRAYFTKIAKDMIKYREENNITQNDLMQMLINLKYEKTEKDLSTESQNIVIDNNVIAAQIYVFLLAGFDGSSSTISFTVYELALNPKIQKKLYDEIRIIYKKHGCFSYDAISEMKYLDCVVRETLRKYPPTSMTHRMCGESYKIPGSNVVIEKGTKVIVPICAIHHDPVYYENPSVFDPDRFLDKNKKLRDSYTFLPFGEGPRICIGMKIAYMQIKMCIAALIANYELELSEKTSIPLEFHRTVNTLISKSGIWLRIHRRPHDFIEEQF